MIIEKNFLTRVRFEELEIGDCFMLSSNADDSVFLKVDGNNSSKNAVNLTRNLLNEVNSYTTVFPVKATLTVEYKENEHENK